MCNLRKKIYFQTSSYSPLFWKMGKVGETGARPFQAEIRSHSHLVRRIQRRRCSPFQNRVPLREMALPGIQRLTNQAAESVWNGQKSCLGFTTSAAHGSARRGQVHFSSIPTAGACSDEWFHSSAALNKYVLKLIKCFKNSLKRKKLARDSWERGSASRDFRLKAFCKRWARLWFVLSEMVSSPCKAPPGSTKPCHMGCRTFPGT